MRLRILADENIPFAREAFDELGEVRLAPGRDLDRSAVRDFDALAVRSVTRVDRALLEGSRVRFVATATIGTDHVDESYLREKGIGFAAAPGSNAESVAEYVVSALFATGRALRGSSIGIVGVGNVGSRVRRNCRALGMRAVLNDPPLARETGDEVFRPLEELFGCDFLTFHVPLSRTGEDATYHMIDSGLLSRLRPDAVLFNTSRGAVAETSSLLGAAREKRLAACILDVWENEPGIDAEVARLALVGTPHIAGYSFDGKVRGTEMVRSAVARHFRRADEWDPSLLMPPPVVVRLDLSGLAEEEAVAKCVRAVYDVREDDRRLKETLALPSDERAAAFDRLRKDYSVRREFDRARLELQGANPAALAALRGLRFLLP